VCQEVSAGLCVHSSIASSSSHCFFIVFPKCVFAVFIFHFSPCSCFCLAFNIHCQDLHWDFHVQLGLCWIVLLTNKLRGGEISGGDLLEKRLQVKGEPPAWSIGWLVCDWSLLAKKCHIVCSLSDQWGSRVWARVAGVFGWVQFPDAPQERIRITTQAAKSSSHQLSKRATWEENLSYIIMYFSVC